MPSDPPGPIDPLAAPLPTGAGAAARQALSVVAEAPTEDRGGRRIVPTSHATGAELDDIELALDNPPPKADHFGTLIAILGAAALILKTIASPVDHAWKDLAVIVVTSLAAGAQLLRYAKALFAKTPSKDLAKQHLRQLKRAQGWRPEEPKRSGWTRARDMIWKIVIASLEHRLASRLPSTSKTVAKDEPLAERKYARITVDELVGFYRDHLHVQADKLAEQYMEQWITVEGAVAQVQRSFKDLQVTLHMGGAITGVMVMLEFGPEWETRLLDLESGEVVRVSGKIADVFEYMLRLRRCELVEASAPAGPPRLAS